MQEQVLPFLFAFLVLVFLFLLPLPEKRYRYVQSYILSLWNILTNFFNSCIKNHFCGRTHSESSLSIEINPYCHTGPWILQFLVLDVRHTGNDVLICFLQHSLVQKLLFYSWGKTQQNWKLPIAKVNQNMSLGSVWDNVSIASYTK